MLVLLEFERSVADADDASAFALAWHQNFDRAT
jgi:hypothetical protein